MQYATFIGRTVHNRWLESKEFSINYVNTLLSFNAACTIFEKFPAEIINLLHFNWTQCLQNPTHICVSAKLKRMEHSVKFQITKHTTMTNLHFKSIQFEKSKFILFRANLQWLVQFLCFVNTKIIIKTPGDALIRHRPIIGAQQSADCRLILKNTYFAVLFITIHALTNIHQTKFQHGYTT